MKIPFISMDQVEIPPKNKINVFIDKESYLLKGINSLGEFFDLVKVIEKSNDETCSTPSSMKSNSFKLLANSPNGGGYQSSGLEINLNIQSITNISNLQNYKIKF